MKQAKTRLQYLREKRDGGKSSDDKREQLAGAQAPAKGKRDENESRQTDRKKLLRLHVLGIVGGLETKTAGRAQGRLCGKVKKILCRKRAAALPLSYTFTRLNQVLRGWINYF